MDSVAGLQISGASLEKKTASFHHAADNKQGCVSAGLHTPWRSACLCDLVPLATSFSGRKTLEDQLRSSFDVFPKLSQCSLIMIMPLLVKIKQPVSFFLPSGSSSSFFFDLFSNLNFFCLLLIHDFNTEIFLDYKSFGV